MAKVAAVLNLGLNNLLSITSALRSLDGLNDVVVFESAAELTEFKPESTILVLPGTGNFGAAMEVLLERDLVLSIHGWLGSGGSVIGICLGMQLLFQGSDESPMRPGLAILEGTCRRLPSGEARVPNIGWSNMKLQDSLSRENFGFLEERDAYFVHSYFCPVIQGLTLATSSHGGMEFSAIVKNERVVGLQFHPEKSSSQGLRILEVIVGML